MVEDRNLDRGAALGASDLDAVSDIDFRLGLGFQGGVRRSLAVGRWLGGVLQHLASELVFVSESGAGERVEGGVKQGPDAADHHAGHVGSEVLDPARDEQARLRKKHPEDDLEGRASDCGETATGRDRIESDHQMRPGRVRAEKDGGEDCQRRREQQRPEHP